MKSNISKDLVTFQYCECCIDETHGPVESTTVCIITVTGSGHRRIAHLCIPCVDVLSKMDEDTNYEVHHKLFQIKK